MCGGYEAGSQAAQKALGITGYGKINEDLAVDRFANAFAPLHGEGRLSYQELEEAVRNVMAYYMGFQRSETGMSLAAQKIDFLMGEAQRLHASSYRELMRCIESREILTVCSLAIAASRERKESGRCVYSRVDYPELDPAMNRPLLLWQEKGTACIAWD